MTIILKTYTYDRFPPAGIAPLGLAMVLPIIITEEKFPKLSPYFGMFISTWEMSSANARKAKVILEAYNKTKRTKKVIFSFINPKTGLTVRI